VGGFSRLGARVESGCVWVRASGRLWARVLSLGESGCLWVSLGARASGESLSSLGARESYLCTSPNDSPTREPREAAVTPGLLPAERMESGLCERGGA
jgi:hypothetical protein